MAEPMKKTPFPAYLFILVLPFLILYWFVPFLSGLSIGNDYQNYGIENQMELLFSIKTGSFPLYSPGYALGQSSVVLTWSQIFHPISYLASVMPGYWEGKALHWHTFFKLLSLGLTHLVLFLFLRKLRLNNVLALVLSLITVYNLRTIDLIRFGPSLEAYTAHLLLCAAVGWYFIHPSRLTGPLGIIFFTYLLVVSGHPQMMYYGILGSIIFLFVAPFFISDMLPGRQINFRNALSFSARSGFFFTLGILLSFNYILPFYFDFYASNTSRVGSSYQFSLGTQSLFGVISNFFMPFLSDVHGAFGGSSIILPAAMLPALKLFRLKIPRSVWVIWGVFLLLVLFMLGDRTPVHRLAWEYLPFMSSFRNPGRISMIIPIFLMLLLAWTAKPELPLLNLKRIPVRVTPYSLLAIIALMLFPLYILIYLVFKPALGWMPPISINNIPLWTLALILFSGFASLVLLSIHGSTYRATRITGILLCLLSVIQIGAILRYGTFIVPVKDRITFKEMLSQKKEKLDYRYHDLPGMQHSAVIGQIRNSFYEPFLGKIYTEIIPVESRNQAYNMMKDSRAPHQLFIENYNPEKAKKITEAARKMKNGRVELAYSSFNRLAFRVVSGSPAFFGLSYPYTGHWRAWVNDKRVIVYRANGNAHAVEIPAGENLVEFRYWSSGFFWGMMVTSIIFVSVGIWSSFRVLKYKQRFIGAITVIFVAAGLFFLWYDSLYSGDNLETQYEWTYSPPPDTPNLAYGKKTYGFELPSTSYLQYHRSRAVDGEKEPGSGFVFNPGEEKKLIVDLNHIKNISKIKLYGHSELMPVISYSQDGKQWHNAGPLIRKNENTIYFFQVDFSTSVMARFIKVTASDAVLRIDELEVY